MHRGITWHLVNIRTYTQSAHRTKTSNRRITFNAIARHALATVQRMMRYGDGDGEQEQKQKK